MFQSWMKGMDWEEHTLHDSSVGNSRTGSQIDGDRNLFGEEDQQGRCRKELLGDVFILIGV